jgi:5-methylcytosine-specific restriction protein A
MSGTNYSEGAGKSVLVTSYERNAKARRECLLHYGHKCVICHFSFGSTYGVEFEDYIHVHHLQPIAQSGGVRNVNPIKDLRPVCPNCHAVIHSEKPPLTIQKVQELIKQQKTR